tara:strand:+ start:1640 stop:2242 length:603 start_codon:yes stop_codon:yes gene_type:complete
MCPHISKPNIELIAQKYHAQVSYDLDEINLAVPIGDLYQLLLELKDNQSTQFEQLIDLCGVDYLCFGREGSAPWDGPRYAVVYHLLSVSYNNRARIVVWLPDEELKVPSVLDIWKSANWFEREVFDLFGIIFDGHPDLRRILTDYGFIGYPFRKDFPLSGHVEMRYDETKKRVVYEPVTIEPRVTVPRVIREEGYGDRDT